MKGNGIMAVLWLSVAMQSFGAAGIDPLEDHPRPDWARPWVNLNGAWRFDFDPQDVGVKERWFENHRYPHTITVPFPWQSALGGVREAGGLEYQGAAWYERDVVIPPEAGPRIFLVFGAVDWHATVWVNGRHLATHNGGYLPFEVELTDLVRPGETARVTVRAYDITDPETPTGKQTGWYTPSGGIWQTVYLEWRGDSYVQRARIIPDIDHGAAVFDCEIVAAQAGLYRVDIESTSSDRKGCDRSRHGFRLEPGLHTVRLRHEVKSPRLWSPDSPTLYATRIDLTYSEEGSEAPKSPQDSVHTYFGLRKVSRGRYGAGEHEYVLLNDKPIFLRGALHQSFNPDGIYTHPTDDYLRRDYEKAKEFGLNFLRIHIKVDEPRALYWADRLGVMIMCDMPNYARHTPRSQQAWEETLRGAIARDFNHPSVIAWCCFNETWGIGDGGYTRDKQDWVRDMYLLAKRLDPTRLVEDNSPCHYDHTVTDINSWHFYIDDFERARRHIEEVVANTFPGSQFNYAEGWNQDSAPLMNSEYGGVSAGSGDRDIAWVFLFLTNLLRKHGTICGYVYTELEDIEWEHNGFMNYDRSDKEYHYPAGITPADLQGADFPVIDGPPYLRKAPGDRVVLPVLLSHWSERDGLMLRMSAHGETLAGRPWQDCLPSQEQLASAAPFTVEAQGAFEFELPEENGLLFAVVEVLENGRRVGANYCVIDVRSGPGKTDPKRCEVAIPVGTFTAHSFAEGAFFAPEQYTKIWGFGTGYIEYRVPLPEGLDANGLESCRFVAEIGAKADAERLDWPARRHKGDYPQTDGRKWPTEVVISINGVPFHRAVIADDWADARGVLSHVQAFHHGSHGELVRAALTGEALETLRKALRGDRMVTLRIEVPQDARHAGGLALYGAEMGAYPADPTLVLEFAREAAGGHPVQR